MEFGGYQSTSLIDYPDKLSTVLFTKGCNFRCPYCHNAELIIDDGEKIKEANILDFLKKRTKIIDAVCLSGGECTLHQEIYDFIQKVKALGYLIKIDTNGTNPKLLKRLIEEGLLDYIAMDVKAPLEKYDMITNTKVDIHQISESLRIIKNSNIQYEFRTTVCKELLNMQDIESIGKLLSGSKTYVIQNFKDGDTILGGKNKFTPYGREELIEMKEKVKNYLEEVKIRF